MMNLETKVNNLPQQPGVYLMKDKADRVIYVGKAAILRSRVRSYFISGGRHSPRIAAMVQKIADIDYIVTNSETEALILECNLIKEYRPRYNVDLKDDKSYPYLKLTKETYPRLYLTRNIKKDGSRYFGPYANVGIVRDTLRILKKLFPLRSCRQPLTGKPTGIRPCLNYQLGLCLAPCQGNISEGEYHKIVEGLVLFLEGKQDQLYRRLYREMRDAADRMDYENAARVRDRLSGIEQIIERQKVISQKKNDWDVIALARDEGEAMTQVFQIRSGKLVSQISLSLRNGADLSDSELMSAFIKSFYGRTPISSKQVLVSAVPEDKELLEQWLTGMKGSKVMIHCPKRGEKKRLVDMARENAGLHIHEKKKEIDLVSARRQKELDALINLAKIAGLEGPPMRIEGYDISHFAGEETVGSMVVFQEGKPDKENYRHFIIKEVTGIDDYASLQEVVRRRLNNKAYPEPDLLLIDGGKGQLNAVIKVVSEMGRKDLSVISLAKEYEQIFIAEQKAPIILPAGDAALQLLQRVRDEAHRFAVTFQRKRRNKASLDSVLTGAPGIGPKRRKYLLQEFGSIEKIRDACPEELAAAAGMTSASAQQLYNYLHQE